jgi:hypothetical protein
MPREYCPICKQYYNWEWDDNHDLVCPGPPKTSNRDDDNSNNSFRGQGSNSFRRDDE